MRRFIPVILLAAGALASCNNASKPSSTESVTTIATPPPPPESALGKEATGELMNMVSAYYSLKDALVATDGARADKAASKLMSAAEILSSELDQQPLKPQLYPELQIIMNRSEAITAASPEAIEEKRAEFSPLSDALYKVLTTSKLQHGGVYQQYCPMAFNNKGGYWLSGESDIKNPYFGNKMLECGEVKDSL